MNSAHCEKIKDLLSPKKYFVKSATVRIKRSSPPLKKHYIKCHFEEASLSFSAISAPYKWVWTSEISSI